MNSLKSVRSVVKKNNSKGVKSLQKKRSKDQHDNFFVRRKNV